MAYYYDEGSVPHWLISKSRGHDWDDYPHWTWDDYLIAYVDGCCRNNGQPEPRAGVGVWFGEDHPL
jgi:hypothetical protein